ncbi:hypothetical protein AAW00_00035 [Aurantiacibacter luteus]|uniref:Transglutaminase n=1 Tax=Aurantiacibacter luteus TaxID=1581420 RepID=A0A0G9N358_9SPHN|nr:hypothetical protein AAW00_00035 [Aurantiacibacter luteus]
MPAQASLQPVTPGVAGEAKSAAILGGAPSALDLIRQQQAASLAAVEVVAVQQVALERAQAETCLVGTAIDLLPRRFEPMAAPLPAPPIAGAHEGFLATAVVRIGRTPFSREWDRVSHSALGPGRVTALVGEASPDAADTLRRVNAWVNTHIAPVEDSVGRGARDYWATAGETLGAGFGDCEDYAILKYQMLAALGFDSSTMYLTLARDLVRNADHAVLVVRVDGQHFLLDNAVDAVLPADQSYDYRPTMSFNSESSWLHGYAGRS